MLKKSIKNELILLGTKGGPAIRPNSSMPSSSLLILDKKKILVNSAHHQAVKDPGRGLKINARSSDGVIEGIEDPLKNFCIGVQWHPEFLIQNSDFLLFKKFINCC